MLFLDLMGLVLFMIVMFFFIVVFAGIILHPPWWYWRESHTVTIVQQQPTQQPPPPTQPSIQYHIHLNGATTTAQELPPPSAPPIRAQRPDETIEGEWTEQPALNAPRPSLRLGAGPDEFEQIRQALGAPRARQLPHKR